MYILYVNDIYIYHDSTWKHLRQPCANLAPSLCFAGFPCVTPHNELVKSYKSVGCVPPRLKFLFRTFDRLSYIYNVLISEMYLSIYGLLTHIQKKLLAPLVAPHHLPGKFLQVTAPMVVVMVIKTDKATSPPANKAKRFEADPGSEVRIGIDSKSTQYSLITCFVDVFVAL